MFREILKNWIKSCRASNPYISLLAYFGQAQTIRQVKKNWIWILLIVWQFCVLFSYRAHRNSIERRIWGDFDRSVLASPSDPIFIELICIYAMARRKKNAPQGGSRQCSLVLCSGSKGDSTYANVCALSGAFMVPLLSVRSISKLKYL